MDFPRTILPVKVTDLEVPGPLISKAQSGRVNMRATTQVGRSWTETYLVRTRDLAAKAFLATVRSLWRAGTIFDIAHMDYLTPNGVGGGSPLVNGANQTGASLVVDATPNNLANWLRTGDPIRLAGLNITYEVTADVTTVGTTATIPINPPLFIGGSPADNAVVTITGVKMSAVILEPPSMPETGPDDFGTLTLKFSEAL